jgi:hypothetical protein
MLDDFQSEYLASYTRLYEIGHPGNAAWKDDIVKHATGYSRLGNNIQTNLCSSLVLWNKQNQSRILTKNHENEWAEVTESAAEEFAHKQLMREDNAIVDFTLRYLDYLSSETKFGIWRDTALHQTFIPSLLRSLELQILHLPHTRVVDLQTPLSVYRYHGLRSPQSFVPRFTPVHFANTGSGIPPAPKIVEPYLGAWLKVGDDVEGRYHSIHNEWYRGTIINVQGYDMVWDVKYHDGETDIELCRRCVRPFLDYKVGEEVEYHSLSDETELWYRAHILEVLGDDTYSFRQVDDSTRIYRIKVSDIRRFKSEDKVDDAFQLGDEVEGRFYDEDDNDHNGKWYLGTVVTATASLDQDRTYRYGVEFFDGDSSELEAHDIRALS